MLSGTVSFAKLLQRMKKQVNNTLTAINQTGWRWLAGLILSLLVSAGWAQTTQEELINRCGVVDHERILQQRDPSRLGEFNKLNRLIQQAEAKSPLKLLADINDVGAMLVFLASDYAKSITGDTIYIDSGFHIMGA